MAFDAFFLSAVLEEVRKELQRCGLLDQDAD